MADKKLKRLLEGLLSDIPAETSATEAAPQEDMVSGGGLGSLARLERQAIHLQTASEISHAASSTLSLDELLPQVVDLIRRYFGLYYVGVFLVERVPGVSGEWAVLQAGTEEAGRQMVEQGHRLQVGGESMIGWCIAHRRARIALDVGAEAVRFDNPFLPDTRSEMALPLIGRGRVIGAMTFQSSGPAAFSDEDIAALQNMADQVANAIDNARLFEDRERRISQLATVNEIGQAVSSIRDLDLLLETVYQQVSRLFDTTNFYIATWDGTSDDWALALDVERGEPQPISRHRVTAGLSGYIIRNRCPLLLRTAGEFEELHRAEGIEPLGDRPSSWLGVPLLAAGRIVGVMAIQDYEREHQYGDQDVSLLSTIAAQVANAVENVRLLQRTRRWAQDLSALHGLSLELAQEQRDLNTLLETITRRSMDLLDSDGGGIWLWQPEDEELELVVTRQVGDTDFAGRRLKPGEGLTGRAFVDGQIRVVDDYLAWDGHAGTFDDAPFSSAMAVPMIWQNQMGGVLVLTRSQPGRPFLADEQNLAGLLASQAAAVMQNANLFEHARIRAEEQAMLLQVIEAVHRSSEMHALLESALEMVLATMRLDAGLVSLRNEETGDLYLVAHRGLPEAMARTLEQRGLAGTLCEYVLDTGQTIAIADVRQGAPVDVSSLIRHGLPMYAGTCLTYKGDRLGTCCFFHRAARKLTARELSLLEAIASQISVGVQNARLFEQTQAALSETAMLYRVARSLGQITDEREMFEFVLSEYLGSLDLAQGGVLIFDEDGQNATFRALMVDGKPAEPGLRIPVAGNPACEKLIATREPVVITDVLNDQLLGPVQGLTGGLGYKSMLLVPIVVGSRVVGALGADSVEAVYEFSSQDVALVRAVADQLGIAMENRRLIRETQAALAEVEATHRGYLRRAWQDHIRQREALHRSAFLLDRTGSGAEEDWSAVPDLWRPEMDLAVREGRHAAGNGGGDQERAGLAIPITLRGQTIGVLGVESPADDHQWTEDDVALIQAVGDQLAQALETARLFADTQRRAERERLIGEITTKIRASTDMRDILETAATELGRALGTSRALVRVGMEGLDPRRPGGSPPSATSSPAKDQAVTGGDE